MIAFEVAFDYLDCLCEMPSVDPVAKGRLLTQALLVAVQPGRNHQNYYGHSSTGDDGGYLRALTDTCQDVLSSLPAYSLVSDALIRVTRRIVTYQSLNHGDAKGTHEAFAQWQPLKPHVTATASVVRT